MKNSVITFDEATYETDVAAIRALHGITRLQDLPDADVTALAVNMSPVDGNARSLWWKSASILTESANVPAYILPDLSAYRSLHARLLKFGGAETCFPGPDPDLYKVLERAFFMSGRSKRIRGRPNRCHSNCSRLWLDSPENRYICTGYGLSSDGMWRSHTWIVEKFVSRGKTRTRLLETTEPRIAYYGVVLTLDEAAEFAAENP